VKPLDCSAERTADPDLMLEYGSTRGLDHIQVKVRDTLGRVTVAVSAEQETATIGKKEALLKAEDGKVADGANLHVLSGCGIEGVSTVLDQKDANVSTDTAYGIEFLGKAEIVSYQYCSGVGCDAAQQILDVYRHIPRYIVELHTAASPQNRLDINTAVIRGQ
jgi:hypothetical protein